VLGLKAVNCQSGEHAGGGAGDGGVKEKVLDALGEAAIQVAHLSWANRWRPVQKFDVPLEQATTSSLEALISLQPWIEGVLNEKSPAASLPYFQHGR